MKSRLRWLLWVTAAIPVGYYVGTVLWYAYDFPYMDDYPVIVDFLNQLPSAQTFGAKTALLLEQNNFHRLGLAKLIAWTSVALTGSVDFRLLQYAGLCLLLGTSWLLWRSYSYTIFPRYSVTITAPQPGLRSAYFLPVLFLLFQFQGWNIAFWGIVAVSNVGAPALALLAFWLGNRKREGWAIGLGLVALFTNGNGILVLPLLAGGWALQRHPRRTLAAVAVAIPALWFYFQGYKNPAGPSLGALLRPDKLVHLLALDTAFLGALVYHPAVPWLPILLGSLTLAWTMYLAWIRYDRQNPTLFWLLLFLHLSGLMLAINRVQNDTSIVFASRYRNITALHTAATYLTVVDVLIWRDVHWLKRHLANWVAGLVALGAVSLWAVSNVTYQSKIVRFRELKQTDNLFWLKYGLIRGCAPIYDAAGQLGIMAERMTFRPDETTRSFTALQSHPVNNVSGGEPSGGEPFSPTPGDSLQYGLDFTQLHNDGFFVVTGWAKVAGRKANFNDTFVGVKTATGWQYYTTLFHQRLDKEDSANDKDTGFTAIIPADSTPDSVAIFVRSGKHAAMKALLSRNPLKGANAPRKQRT